MDRADTIRSLGSVSVFFSSRPCLLLAGYVALFFEERVGEPLAGCFCGGVGPAAIAASSPCREPEEGFESVLNGGAGEHESEARVEQAHAGSDATFCALKARAFIDHHAVECAVQVSDAGHGGRPHAGYASTRLANSCALVAHTVLLAPCAAGFHGGFAGLGISLVPELVVPLVGTVEAEGLIAGDVELGRTVCGRRRVEAVAEELFGIFDRAQRDFEELCRRDRHLVVQ